MIAPPIRPRYRQESGIAAASRLAHRGTPYGASLSFATTTHLWPLSDPPSRKPANATGHRQAARSIPGRALASSMLDSPCQGSRTGLTPPISTSVPSTHAAQTPAPRARPSRRHPRRAIQPGDQATSTPTTTAAEWGHFKPSRRGQCKPSFSSAISSTRCPCWCKAPKTSYSACGRPPDASPPPISSTDEPSGLASRLLRTRPRDDRAGGARARDGGLSAARKRCRDGRLAVSGTGRQSRACCLIRGQRAVETTPVAARDRVQRPARLGLAAA